MRLLSRRLAVVEQRGLGVVVSKLFRLAAYLGLFVGGILPRGHRHKALRRAGLKRASAGQRIWLVRHAPARNRLPVHAVALVVVYRRNRRIDGKLVKVRSTQPRYLRVNVGVNTAGKQRVV